MKIKINDIRNFQIPGTNNQSSPNLAVDKKYINNKVIKNSISPKSQIVYTLHDCSFNFFESKNYDDNLEIGGYGSTISYTPKNLDFNIIFKSVTRYSNFPLINYSYDINTENKNIFSDENNPDDGTSKAYFDSLNKIVQDTVIEPKGFANQLLANAAQTVANQSLNYLDSLETKLREVRGSAVNELLIQFRDLTNINKIEPDNVYHPDFNNRASLKNYGKSLASGLLNELEEGVRNAANF